MFGHSVVNPVRHSAAISGAALGDVQVAGIAGAAMTRVVDVGIERLCTHIHSGNRHVRGAIMTVEGRTPDCGRLKISGPAGSVPYIITTISFTD